MKTLTLLAIILALTAETPAKKLDAFVGTWRGTSTAGASANAPPVVFTNSCAWSENQVFLICQGRILGKKPRYSLSIYNYDADAKRFNFLGITHGGASRTSLSVNGPIWEYEDEATDDLGKKTYYRTLNIFESRNFYRYVSQVSSDDVHWKETAAGSVVRIR